MLRPKPRASLEGPPKQYPENGVGPCPERRLCLYEESLAGLNPEKQIQAARVTQITKVNSSLGSVEVLMRESKARTAAREYGPLVIPWCKRKSVGRI